MLAIPDYKPIIRKLLDKSELGRLEWEKAGGFVNGFSCTLDRYEFIVWRHDDKYWLRMLDVTASDELFTIIAEEEVVYRDPANKELFGSLRNLYELARQKGLNLDENLATASALLDRV